MEYNFEYTLKNIGDSPLYNFEFETYIKIQWLLFGKCSADILVVFFQVNQLILPLLLVVVSQNLVHIDFL